MKTSQIGPDSRPASNENESEKYTKKLSLMKTSQIAQTVAHPPMKVKANQIGPDSVVPFYKTALDLYSMNNFQS